MTILFGVIVRVLPFNIMSWVNQEVFHSGHFKWSYCYVTISDIYSSANIHYLYCIMFVYSQYVTESKNSRICNWGQTKSNRKLKYKWNDFGGNKYCHF